MRSSSRLSCLALALLAAPAFAGDGSGHRAELFFGPLITGQPIRLDLRTSVPSAPLALLFGFNGTPFVPSGPGLPPFGLNPGTATVMILMTDATGRLQITGPAAGPLIPAGSGLTLFFQAAIKAQGGQKIVSNVKATEIQPLPVAPGFLHDVSAQNLPAGYDTLGGSAIEHADLNRDGFPDLVIARDMGVAIWMNDGTGQFSDETVSRIAMPGDAVNTIVLGDVDNDRDVDLVTGGGFDDFVSVPDRLWLNDGTGVFTQDASFPPGIGLTQRLELADFDLDGDLDLVAGVGQEPHLAAPGGHSRLLINTAGHFVEDASFSAAAWNPDAGSSTAIRPGDVDSDGDLDLFVARGNPAQTNVLLLNDGSAFFTDVTATNIVPLRTDNSQDATFADIDNDGDLDILVANSVLSVPASLSGDVLVNQGGKQGGSQGAFIDNVTSFLESSTAFDGIRLSIHAADIESDGDLDVLVTVHELGGANHLLFLNQGGAQGGVVGAMIKQSWFDPGDFISYGADLFDMDHDGDLDVLMTAGGVVISPPGSEFQARLYENTQL